MSKYLTMKKDVKVMKKLELTIQEIWAATRPVVYENKKKYSRKPKHPKRDE